MKFFLSRLDLLKNLTSDEEFDVLVIGGGATGCGVALDATTRGSHLVSIFCHVIGSARNIPETTKKPILSTCVHSVQ